MTDAYAIPEQPEGSQLVWRDLDLHGRSAIVTGAARGIGMAIVFKLAGLGARTMLWDIDEAQAKRATQEIRDALRRQDRPHQVEWERVDVTELDRVIAATDRFAAGGLDVLVNNAGTTSVERADSMPLEVWDRTMRLNLFGTYYCCRAAIPHLRRSPGGSIVNISSSSALVGGGGGVHYAASKAAVDGITRQLARELAPDVRVNSIQPRSVETDLFTARYAHAPAERAALMARIPLARLGQPDDIASAAAFLASDWSGYITGQILLIDGGRTHQ
jgi:NAD(P)-dependent dehydrogenase (short-subunit alcohol dehydrogenase family)